MSKVFDVRQRLLDTMEKHLLKYEMALSHEAELRDIQTITEVFEEVVSDTDIVIANDGKIAIAFWYGCGCEVEHHVVTPLVTMVEAALDRLDEYDDGMDNMKSAEGKLLRLKKFLEEL